MFFGTCARRVIEYASSWLQVPSSSLLSKSILTAQRGAEKEQEEEEQEGVVLMTSCQLLFGTYSFHSSVLISC